MKRGYTTAEAANYIGASNSFLRQGRMKKNQNEMDVPLHTPVSGTRKIIYLKEDLDAWLDAQVARREVSV